MNSADTVTDRRQGWQWLAAVIGGLFLIACVFKFQVLGFTVTGWAWLGGLLVALAALLKTGTTAVTLPFQYWAPWVLLVLVYIGWGKEYALQSAAQILCPLLVGAAASALRPDKNDIEGFLKWCRVAAVVFLVIIVFLRVPMLLFGQLPETTGLAPEAMSAMLFQSLFLCSWLLRRNKTDLFLYLALAGFVVVSLVRGPVLGSLALVLLTLAPLGLGRRIAIAVAAAVIGLVVFNMPLMQRKMFWSGHGTLADVTWENPDLRKHTRDLMWKRLWSGIEEQPWLGHGGNADATDLLAAGFPIYLPHNDWLRILFNYGIVGCVLYAGAMILQILHGWRWAGLSPPHTRVLLFAGLSAFVPYAVVMFTDNILIYAQFYGNLHFLLLGLAYGSVAVETEQEPVPET